MGFLLAALLVTFVVTHVTLVVRLARRRMWARAGVALVVAPLGPWWAWRAGMRAAPLVWVTAVVLYAVAVAVTGW